jgi:predicted RNA-binding protein with PUA-like domain
MVDIRLTQIFDTAVTREQLAANPVTSQMMVMKKGSRLSIQSVTADEWRAVHEIARCKVTNV